MSLEPLPKNEQELLLSRIAGNVSQEELARIPPEHQKFFQMALGTHRSKNEVTEMNLTGRARPEELEAITKAGIPLDAVPSNTAEFLATHGIFSDEASQIAAMENREGLDVNSIKSVDFENASPEQQAEFRDLMAKFAQKWNTPIIDSKAINANAKTAAPPAKMFTAPASRSGESMFNPPPAPPPAPANASPGDFFKRAMKTSPLPAAAAAAPASPVQQVVEASTEQPVNTNPVTSAAPINLICKKCSFNNAHEYPNKPTKEDVDNRKLAFASTAQGGDGRFRKQFKLFGGQLIIVFRELKNEGNIIYLMEQGKVRSNTSPQVQQLEQLFSIDRIQFRRMCCGLESVQRPGYSMTVPTLQTCIEHHKGDQEAALVMLENYVQNEAFDSESMKMAAAQKWLEFDDTVNNLWQDQSFYEGSH